MRLRTDLWVAALVRRAQLGGASAFIVRKGDAERGDVLVKVATLDGRAAVYVRAFTMDGALSFETAASRGVPESEADADAWIAKQRGRDPDLWVIEIEDRVGRHFLTEPVADDNG